MKQITSQKLLLEYICAIPKDAFKRKMQLEHPEFPINQIDKISEHLQEFCSYSKEGEVLLLFPYVLNNIRFDYPQITRKTAVKELWNSGFDNVGSMKKLGRMYKNWIAVEKEVMDLSQEKQKSMENTKDKEYNNDLQQQ